MLFPSNLVWRVGGSVLIALSLLPPAVSPQVPGAAPQAGEPAGDPNYYVSVIRAKVAAAQTYSFDAAIQVSRKLGETQHDTIAKYQVKLAVAPGGKYLLWVGDKSNLQYLIVSDGKRTWAYAPPQRKYVEVEAIASSLAADPERVFSDGVEPADCDPVLCSNLILPILANLDYSSAAVVDLKTFSNTATESENDNIRWLTVLSPHPENGEQKLTEVALDLKTLQLANLNWTKASDYGDARMFSSLSVNFSGFQLEKPLPASYFFFSADGTNRVRELAIPGLHEAPIVGKLAPNVQFKTRSGKVIRLRDPQADATLVVFSNSGCTPCEKQSVALAAVWKQYKRGEISIIEARNDAADLHASFKVHFVPTTVVIGKDGIVKRFLPGFQDEAQLRALLPPDTDTTSSGLTPPR